MVSSGIPALDRLLGDGYPARSAVLVFGPLGVGKEGLGYWFTQAGIASGDACIYVTRLSVHEVKNDATSYGLGSRLSPTWIASDGSTAKCDINDMAGISFNIKEALHKTDGKDVRIVVDCLSSLLMLNASESVYRFLTHLLAEVKRYNSVLIATIDEGMHPPQVLSAMQQLFDGVIEVRSTQQDGETLPMLTVKRMSGASMPIDAHLIFDVRKPSEVGRSVLHGGQLVKHEERKTSTRIAVLPLANISPDPGDEYLADGLTEELITVLSQMRDLRVIARTSANHYKATDLSVSEIGNQLRVGSILEGSVRKVKNRVRIAVQLIDTATQEHIWSSAYDRELDDVFAIQRDIAGHVGEALKIELLSSYKKVEEVESTRGPEAHTLYLKGRYHWNERSEEGLDKAVQYLEKAVELDPQFARAYAALADCYVVYTDLGWRTPGDAVPRAKEYASKAISLDPSLAEPHAALASLLANYEYRWHDAENEFKRALELNPSYATAYHWYSLVLRILGRLDESYTQIRRASELDPFSRIIGDNVGWELLLRGDRQKAIEQFQKVAEAFPDYSYVHYGLGWAFYMDSRPDDAIHEMRKAVAMSAGDPSYRAELAALLGLVGMRDEAKRIINDLETLAKKEKVNKVEIAIALFGVGNLDEGFSYLQMGYQEQWDTILYFKSSMPWFKDVRKDPRWATFEKRLGFT